MPFPALWRIDHGQRIGRSARLVAWYRVMVETGGEADLRAALEVLKDSFEVIFEGSPLMAHSIDEEGRLIAVNRRWLEVLQYERSQVLGKRSVDFLTAESRIRALQNTLPVFWLVGSARNVWYRMEKGDGTVIEVILDAELVSDEKGDPRSIAILREPDPPLEWEHARALLSTLHDLAVTRQNLGRLIEAVERGGVDGVDLPGYPPGQDGVTWAAAVGLEFCGEVCSNLLGALKGYEEWREAVFAEDEERVADIHRSWRAMASAYRDELTYLSGRVDQALEQLSKPAQ